jgi:hypothetical protein
MSRDKLEGRRAGLVAGRCNVSAVIFIVGPTSEESTQTSIRRGDLLLGQGSGPLENPQ